MTTPGAPLTITSVFVTVSLNARKPFMLCSQGQRRFFPLSGSHEVISSKENIPNLKKERQKNTTVHNLMFHPNLLMFIISLHFRSFLECST